jgi:hypothetical protein
MDSDESALDVDIRRGVCCRNLRRGGTIALLLTTRRAISLGLWVSNGSTGSPTPVKTT